MSMKLPDYEVRFCLTLEWPAMPPSDDPTEDNPHHVLAQFVKRLWDTYYLGDEWGDESTFAVKKLEGADGSLTIKLESNMPEAMGEVMNWFAMEMSYFYPVGTKLKFEKVRD